MTKPMCGAECWTDHRLLVSKFTLRIQPQRLPQGKTLIKRLNVSQPRDTTVSEDLTRELDCKLAELHLGQATIDEDWAVLRDKIHDTAFQLLGPHMRKNQDWFDENDEEIKEMLAEKNRLHRIYQLDQSPAAKIQLSPTSVGQYKPDCARCKTRGLLPKQMKCRHTLTLTTQSASMKP